MATKIVTKNSSTASAVPTASDLVQGELAVNVADKRLFTEDNGGSIVELGTNPSTLTVTGEITANGGIDVTGTATMDGLVVDTSSVGGFKVTNEATSGVHLTTYQGTTNSNVRTAYVDSQEFVVSTGAPTGTTVTERFRIDSSGNVGIGTSSTSGLKTVIKGETGYPATSGTTQTGVLRLAGGTGLYNVLDMGVNESTDTAWIQATRANSLGTYDKLLLNPYGGNVGIGTSSPSSALHVSASAEVVTRLSRSAGSNSLVLFQDPTTTTAPYIGSYGNAMAFGRYGGGESMRIDSSGNVGIGCTPDAWSGYSVLQIGTAGCLAASEDTTFVGANAYSSASGWKYVTTDEASLYQQHSGKHIWYGAASGSADSAVSWQERMRIDSSGNVGIGTTPATGVRLDIRNNSTTNIADLRNANSSGFGLYVAAGDTSSQYAFRAADYQNNALFSVMSDGNLLVGKTTTAIDPEGAIIKQAGDYYSTITSSNNTYHVYDTTNNAYTFYVNANGGISNYSGNNVNLSDEREKKNIELLESQWDSLKQWSLKKFHYNADDDSDNKKLGVIAQEVEAHNPEVIGEFQVDDETTRMAVKEQQMVWMAIKALQEAQTRIETLEARVTKLENN